MVWSTTGAKHKIKRKQNIQILKPTSTKRHKGLRLRNRKKRNKLVLCKIQIYHWNYKLINLPTKQNFK